MRSSALRLVLAAGFALLACNPLARAADVAGAQVYALTARSDVTTVEYYDTTAPIVPPHAAVAAVSPATAQAELDSLGNSIALASAPEPGDFLRALPGTAAGASGAPVPAYPLSVNSSYPTTPRAELKAPQADGAVLVATSSDHESTGQSQTQLSNSGADIGKAFASAHVARPATGEPMVAVASADLRDMTFGGLVHIGSLTSLASMDSRRGQQPRPTTSTTIEGVTLAGVAVTVTPQGIALNGPTFLPVDLGQLAQQLRGAGIDMRYLPAEISPTSVRSAALLVTLTHQDGQGTRTTVLTLGRVSAALSDTTGPSAETGTPTAASAGNGPPGPSPSLALPSLPVPPGAPRLPTVPLPPASAVSAAETPVADQREPTSLLGLYPFCLAAGALVVIGSRVLGLSATRARRGKDVDVR